MLTNRKQKITDTCDFFDNKKKGTHCSYLCVFYKESR